MSYSPNYKTDNSSLEHEQERMRIGVIRFALINLDVEYKDDTEATVALRTTPLTDELLHQKNQQDLAELQANLERNIKPIMLPAANTEIDPIVATQAVNDAYNTIQTGHTLPISELHNV